jgi:hypothetical protein
VSGGSPAVAARSGCQPRATELHQLRDESVKSS